MDLFLVVFPAFMFIVKTTSYYQFVKKGYTVATSSSTFLSFIAARTVDENFNQNIIYCSHTSDNCNINETWLQIDLRKVYSIKSVKFWYRNDRTDGKNAIRLSGYSILISNDSWPNSSCYKDPKSPNLTSLNENDCKATTQYIWFYQQYRAPYDCAPILEICEVQVFGCDVGFYGENCSKTCGLCKTGTCDIVTGQCDDSGCALQEFQAPYCIECLDGIYGENCKMSCSWNCKNNACNRTSGTCLEGCVTGYTGEYCNEKCNNGAFRPNYQCNCSENCIGEKQEQNLCSKMTPIVFSIVGVFCLSLILNIATITWILRQKLCKEKRKYQGGQKFDTTNISVIVSPDTNNTKEDNTDYQELDQINKEYQELGQISGPSLYDKINE